MHSTILKCLSASCLAAALSACPALAEEPGAEAAAEEEATQEEQGPSDEDFAKSFLGKPYSGDLEVEGWTDFGGGLVSPPIYIHQYGREDGTSLVLTSKEVAPATRLAPATHVVTDALIVSKPWKGYAFSTACMQGEDFTLRFVGEARGTEEQEWWTEVRRAWEISIETGEITKIETRGVRCTNGAW